MTTPPPRPRPSFGREVNRRAVAQTGLSAGVLAALLATGVSQVARANAIPVPTNEDTPVGPVRYTLTGDQISIEVTTGDVGDLTELTYEDETGVMTFTGDEIEVIDVVALGQVASVLLDAAPDAFVDYLALLLPGVNPVVGTTDVPINSVAIVIRHLTSIAGPRLVSGPLQTYEVHPLSGTAEFASG